MKVQAKPYRSIPYLPFQPERYRRRSQNKTRHGNTLPTAAQATTGSIFMAARNLVRKIDFNPFLARFDHSIEIINLLVYLSNQEG